MNTALLAALSGFLLASGASEETIADPNFPVIRLPGDFVSQRVTKRPGLGPGETLTMLDAVDAGCVRHFWITLSGDDADSGRGMRLTIVADGAGQPQVDMRMDHFFGVMLDRDAYRIESAAIKLLPRNAFNCYLPIPFARSCRITLTNQHDHPVTVWSMVDWHQYQDAAGLTPYRLHATFHEETPAEKLGSFPMAETSGRGFVAGMVKAVRHIDLSDAWFHTGGDLWLIDGETNPHALRGIGVEDVFGYSFGLYESCSQWTGTPCYVKQTEDQPTEVVAYRFFGPDPVAFRSSLVLRFGSKGNDTQTVVYYYRDPSTDAPEVDSPGSWTILGPFACEGPEDFARAEFPESRPDRWPESWPADFGEYRRRDGPATYRPMPARSEHTWVDLARDLRPFGRTNMGTQPVNVSAYATTTIAADKEQPVRLIVGFDDGLRLWLNGKLVASREHNRGFATAAIPARLAAGENRILVKLSNFDNDQWRLWAFSLRLERER